MKPINTSDIKSSNIKHVFKHLLESAPISRRKLQNLTNLSWGTISATITELIAKNLIFEVDTESNDLGRTPKDLTLNASINHIIGVDVNISGITVVVTDLSGNIIQKWLFPLKQTTKAYILDLIITNLKIILVTYPKVLGIGFSMQGLIDSENGICNFAQFLDDWKEVKMKEIFEHEFNLPTYVYHDPDCLMMNELHSHKILPRSVSNAIIIRLDDCIGMSILVNGKIYVGTHGYSGELGHTTIVPDGAPCPCGKRGCLESYCSAIGVTARYTDLTAKSLPYSDIVSLATSGDEAALSVFSDLGKYLGISIANLINIFDTQLVLINGNITEQKSLFETSLSRQLAHVSPYYKNEIIFSNYAHESACLGSVFFTINKILPLILA